MLAPATAMDGGNAGNAGAVFSAGIQKEAEFHWIPGFAGMTFRTLYMGCPKL
jgi:hypothetical protein